MPKERMDWGLVKIIGGRHKGRIGYYDDEEGKRAVVLFGSPWCAKYPYLIQQRYLENITTADLITRHQEIITAYLSRSADDNEKIELLAEQLLILETLYERMLNARISSATGKKRIFISHSSKDKQFARWLAVDLANVGHLPWLDEWNIRVGESIPKGISQAIDACDYVALILSEHAVASQWVENEWHAKYWAEIEDGSIQLLPVLFRTCTIPTLLRHRKYADFREDHDIGLQELLDAIGTVENIGTGM